jgi:hypothetical protein
MLKVLDQSNYYQALEIIYYVSKNMLFNYPIDSLMNIIDASNYRDAIYDTVQEIELLEEKNIDKLSYEIKEKYLSYFDEVISKRTNEFVKTDVNKSKALFRKISESLSEQ